MCVSLPSFPQLLLLGTTCGMRHPCSQLWPAALAVSPPILFAVLFSLLAWQPEKGEALTWCEHCLVIAWASLRYQIWFGCKAKAQQDMFCSEEK